MEHKTPNLATANLETIPLFNVRQMDYLIQGGKVTKSCFVVILDKEKPYYKLLRENIALVQGEFNDGELTIDKLNGLKDGDTIKVIEADKTLSIKCEPNIKHIEITEWECTLRKTDNKESWFSFSSKIIDEDKEKKEKKEKRFFEPIANIISGCFYNLTGILNEHNIDKRVKYNTI